MEPALLLAPAIRVSTGAVLALTLLPIKELKYWAALGRHVA